MMVAVWSLGLLALVTLFARGRSLAAALGYAVIAFLGTELVVLLVNPLIGVPLPWAECVIWAAVIVLGIVVAARSPRPTVSRRGLILSAAAASGSVILAACLALAQVLPGAIRIEWAMNSDAVNVVAFARQMLDAGGIDPSRSDSPTPLPYAMIASAATPGRAGLPDDAISAHDVVALATTWAFLLTIVALLAGAIAARGARRIPLAAGVLTTVVASVLTLSWFVLGVQLQFGFVTVAFSLALLLAGWLVYVESEAEPPLALAALVVAVAATFAVWSPLVVALVPLGVVIVVRQWGAILRSGWRGLAPVGAAIAIVLGYLAGVGVPVFLRASAFLSADGGFPPIGPGFIIAVSGMTVLVACLSARLRGERAAAIGAIALVAGSLAGLGFLVAQRLEFETIWGYYPAKFAWTIGITLLVITMGMAATLLEGIRLRRPLDAIAAGAGVTLLAGLLWSPAEPQDPIGQLPLVGILGGQAVGVTPGRADEVLPLAGPESNSSVFWGTPYDRWANLWLLQLNVDRLDENPTLRGFAYAWTLGPADICAIADEVPPPLTVHTDDTAAAEAALAEACPDTPLVVTQR